MPPAPNESESTQVRLPRVAVEFKIPLQWLLGLAGVLLWGLVSMYFKLGSLDENVAELKQSVKTFNAQTNQFAMEQALIRQRVDKLERDKDRERADRK